MRLGAASLRRASADPPLGPALHQCWPGTPAIAHRPRHTGRAWRHAGARAVHEEGQGRSCGADLPPPPPRARLARTNRGRGATLPARRLQPCVQPDCNPTFNQGCNPTRNQAATLRATKLQPYVASGCNPTWPQAATLRGLRLQPYVRRCTRPPSTARSTARSGTRRAPPTPSAGSPSTGSHSKHRVVAPLPA